MSDDDTAGVIGQSGQMDAHETAEARVLDPDEYTQKRRIKDVLDARRGVIDDRRELRSAMLARSSSEHIGRRRALEAYRVSLENYITEAEPLFTSKYREQGLSYWQENVLGVQVLYPPDYLTGDVDPSVRKNVSEIEEPATPKRVKFIGLQSILRAPRPLSETFEAHIRDYDGNKEVRRVSVSDPVEWGILDEAYRAVNHFLADLGLDLDPDDSGEEAVGDYSDILNGEYDDAHD